MAVAVSANAAKQLVVVLGAGQGLGSAVGRVFAQRGHPVALLSRTQSKVEDLAKQINKEVGDDKRTRGYAADVTKRDEMERAFASIKKDWHGTAQLHTTVFNTGGFFKVKPFLETTDEDYAMSINGIFHGAVVAFQTFIRSLQELPSWKAWQEDASINEPVGNLLVSGATAAWRGSARMSSISGPSAALRSLSQSVAREFGPQGLHVSYFILDGQIASERADGYAGKAKEAGMRLEPEHIAEVYYNATLQKRSTWQFETDLRPAKEKW